MVEISSLAVANAPKFTGLILTGICQGSPESAHPAMPMGLVLGDTEPVKCRLCGNGYIVADLKVGLVQPAIAAVPTILLPPGA